MGRGGGRGCLGLNLHLLGSGSAIFVVGGGDGMEKEGVERCFVVRERFPRR
jgi:hypothetical protein